MNDDDLGRLLGEALDAQARRMVPEHAAPPARFDSADASSQADGLTLVTPTSHRARRPRWLAPLAAAAAVLVAAGVAVGIDAAHHDSTATVGAPRVARPVQRQAPSVPTTQPTAGNVPVHIKLFNADGATYGVGISVIAYFSKKITSARALQENTRATADGKPLDVAWYFERSDAHRGYPYEAHLRPRDYWPAHAKIAVTMPMKGVSAGDNMTFDDSLTSTFRTGPANIGVVDARTDKMTITTDGKLFGRFPVSLGAPSTPTLSGTKVIMEQAPTVCMHDTNGTYYECGIKYDSRLTYSGEYLHAAPWNVSNIERGVSTSNGCTNLLPNDAEVLYHFLRVGDVMQYPNADGSKMTMGMGFGDWNVPWSTWQTGGLVPTG